MKDQNSLGQKVRALRLARSMTQAQLAGDSITRNMLSLIENGSAVPSLSTLSILAERLQIPMGYFFADNDTENAQFMKMGLMNSILHAFEEHRFEECVGLCASLENPDDEIQLILAQCYMNLAEKSAKACMLSTTTAYLKKADMAAAACIYKNESIHQTAEYITLLIRSIGLGTIPEELGLPASFPKSTIPCEMFAYMRSLFFLQKGEHHVSASIRESGLITCRAYKDVLYAKEEILLGNTAHAEEILLQIPDREEIGFLTRFHVLSTLENCATISGNYRNAYELSSQKVKLLEQFGH